MGSNGPRFIRLRAHQAQQGSYGRAVNWCGQREKRESVRPGWGTLPWDAGGKRRELGQLVVQPGSLGFHWAITTGGQGGQVGRRVQGGQHWVVDTGRRAEFVNEAQHPANQNGTVRDRTCRSSAFFSVPKSKATLFFLLTFPSPISVSLEMADVSATLPCLP